METFEGHLQGKEKRFALVASRFNQPLTELLVEGAKDGLRRHGVEPKVLCWVPGAFELPLVAQKLAASGQYDAVICLGVVIRGETPHFEYVAGQAASGVMRAGLETGIPVIFSVLTTETIEQAQMRAGIKGSNKGFEGALTALEMVDLLQQMACAEEVR